MARKIGLCHFQPPRLVQKMRHGCLLFAVLWLRRDRLLATLSHDPWLGRISEDPRSHQKFSVPAPTIFMVPLFSPRNWTAATAGCHFSDCFSLHPSWASMTLDSDSSVWGFPPDTSQRFSDSSWVSYTSTQFRQCGPGDSVRSDRKGFRPTATCFPTPRARHNPRLSPVLLTHWL